MNHIEAMKQALELLKKLDRDLIIETWELAKVMGGLYQAIADMELQEKRKLLPKCFADYQPNHAVYRSCEWCAVKNECQTGEGIENLHKM